MKVDYFINIKSLPELKFQYRQLVLKHHPDLGGDTETMKVINLQFEKSFESLKDVKAGTFSGYESDYTDADARQYEGHVWNEYRWRGKNYEGQSNREIIKVIRDWVKATYPAYRFSVRREDCNSFYITLLEADFNPFADEAGKIAYISFNHYHPYSDRGFSKRAIEVLKNVSEFASSYRYDNSDSMVDYFDTNFYLNISIGDYKRPFRQTATKITGKGKRVKKTDAERAMGNDKFDYYAFRNGTKCVLGCVTYGSDGKEHFYPLRYSGFKTAQKRLAKLRAVGMQCEINGDMIVLNNAC